MSRKLSKYYPRDPAEWLKPKERAIWILFVAGFTFEELIKLGLGNSKEIRSITKQFDEYSDREYLPIEAFRALKVKSIKKRKDRRSASIDFLPLRLRACATLMIGGMTYREIGKINIASTRTISKARTHLGAVKYWEKKFSFIAKKLGYKVVAKPGQISLIKPKK